MKTMYIELVNKIKKQFPKFEIIYKRDVWMQRVLAFFLKPFNSLYMTKYNTLLFGKLYVGDTWACIDDNQRYTILMHELEHLKDSKRYPIIFELSYLFPPTIFTFRAVWEIRAYKKTFEAMKALRYPKQYILSRKDWFVYQFISSAYIWMCPFKKHMENMFDKIMKEIGLV